MTTIRERAEKCYEDYFSVAPKYRTGQRLQDCCEAALREFGEELAKDSQERANQLGQLAMEAAEHDDTKEALRLLHKKEEALLAAISIRAAIRESL